MESAPPHFSHPHRLSAIDTVVYMYSRRTNRTRCSISTMAIRNAFTVNAAKIAYTTQRGGSAKKTKYIKCREK